MPGAAAPQKATPQAGTKRRLGGEEEGTPPAGKKRRGCPDETLAAMANAMCAAQTIASLGQLPANLPANGLPNSLPAGLPSPGLQEPAPPPQAMDCAVPTAPLEPMDTGTGQVCPVCEVPRGATSLLPLNLQSKAGLHACMCATCEQLQHAWGA